MKPTKRPRIIPINALRFTWPSVLLNSRLTGPPGISHLHNDGGTHVLEHRDEDGRQRSVLALFPSGELTLCTDPEMQRQGLCTALLTEAVRLGLPLNFEKQCYTRAGWAVARMFLQRARLKEESACTTASTAPTDAA